MTRDRPPLGSPSPLCPLLLYFAELLNPAWPPARRCETSRTVPQHYPRSKISELKVHCRCECALSYPSLPRKAATLPAEMTCGRSMMAFRLSSLALHCSNSGGASHSMTSVPTHDYSLLVCAGMGSSRPRAGSACWRSRRPRTSARGSSRWRPWRPTRGNVRSP